MVRELSTLRFGSLKPQPSLTPDGLAMLVSLVRPAGALAGEGELLVDDDAFVVAAFVYYDLAAVYHVVRSNTDYLLHILSNGDFTSRTESAKFLPKRP